MKTLVAEPRRFLRVAVPLLFCLFALSGLWRFQGGLLGTVAAVAYVAAHLVALATAVFVLVVLARRKTSQGR